MLETIREFGLEQLEASGEAEQARGRHAAFFLVLAEEANAVLDGPKQGSGLERLETEHDNIRSALGWSLTQEPETALRLVVALYWFWSYRGYLTEGRDWTERALATGASAAPEVQARALTWSSNFAGDRADYTTATARADEALALARSVDDRSSEGWALMSLGIIATHLGDVKRAAVLSAEAEARFRSIGERLGIAAALFDQAVSAGDAGDVDRQQELFERSLAEFRASGERVQASWNLRALAYCELERGHLDRSRALFEEALETAREFRFGLVEGWALLGLAEVAGEQGDASQAATYLQDAETKFRELGHGRQLAEGLNHSGYLALLQGNHEQARRLIEEAVALARESAGPSAVANIVHSLGDVLRASGDVAGAAVQYRDALVLAQESGDSVTTPACLAGLAGLAVDTGRYQEASRLFGAVEALRDTVGIPPSRYEKEWQSQDLATVLEALGAEDDAEARAAGRVLPLPAAVSEALMLADEIARAIGPVGPRNATGEPS